MDCCRCLGFARNGKMPLMLIGLAAFMAETLAFWVCDHAAFDRWWELALVYACQGLGRGMYESTNKAIIADMWATGADTAAAFANVNWTFGVAAAVGFFMFPHMDKSTVASICFVTNVCAAGCYLCIARAASAGASGQQKGTGTGGREQQAERGMAAAARGGGGAGSSKEHRTTAL